MRRVLRPGGRIGISDIVAEDRSHLRSRRARRAAASSAASPERCRSVSTRPASGRQVSRTSRSRRPTRKRRGWSRRSSGPGSPAPRRPSQWAHPGQRSPPAASSTARDSDTAGPPPPPRSVAQRGRSTGPTRSPLTSAGPSERAGFIDAPLTGPPTSAPSATALTDGDCRSLVRLRRVSVATATITSIRKNVRTPSQTSACPTAARRLGDGPDQRVAEGQLAGQCGRGDRAGRPGPASRARRATPESAGRPRRPAVTAGLKCAPETCPRA